MAGSSKSVTRRRALRFGASLVLAGTGLAGPAWAEEQKSKARKKVVYYQWEPNGAQKCGDCSNFIAATNECEQVDGWISEEGWCRLWAPEVGLERIPEKEHEVPPQGRRN